MPSGKEASMDNEGGAAAASSLELLSAAFILAIVAC